MVRLVTWLQQRSVIDNIMKIKWITTIPLLILLTMGIINLFRVTDYLLYILNILGLVGVLFLCYHTSKKNNRN